MSLDQLIRILSIVTLFEMMVAIGLGVTLADVVRVGRDWRCVGRAAAANYVLVPLAAFGLLLLFDAHPMVAAGFMIAAVCPGAPYGPPLTAVARGSVQVAVGLMVILAGSSALLAPLLLKLLLPPLSGGQPLSINVGKMVLTLAVSQFLPLCIGLLVRQRYPAAATRLKRPAGALTTLLNIALIGVILAAQYRMLLEIRIVGYLGMLALLVAAIAAGWWLGGKDREARTAMTMATSIRNVGVGLVIVTDSFAGTAAVPATTAYALFQTVMMALVAVAWGRWASGQRKVLTGSAA